jgi:molybdopterin molybdotransferase
MSNSHDDMLWRDGAVDLVVQRREETLSGWPTESVPLDGIGGRVLAEPIVAERDVPAHDHATMDGFAFDATDEYPLSLVGEERFPETEPGSIGPGEAVRIATGGPLPEGANAVLKREEATVEDGMLRGTPTQPGTYTYEQGSNLAAGDRLFEAGETLSPKDAILLKDLGLETVDVYERFSAAVLATGTEIHEGKTDDLDSPMLADAYDVVLTTGGTSVGRKDYVIRVLDSLGEVAFHRVRIRPGKPLAMAHLPDHDAVAFAIPGKPIGAHTISTFVMRPFFVGDAPIPTVGATLVRDVELGPGGFEYFVPVCLDEGGDGHEAMPMGHTDSQLSVYDRQFDPSVLSSSSRASRADGVVITREPMDAGETVEVIPYPAIE